MSDHHRPLEFLVLFGSKRAGKGDRYRQHDNCPGVRDRCAWCQAIQTNRVVRIAEQKMIPSAVFVRSPRVGLCQYRSPQVRSGRTSPPRKHGRYLFGGRRRAREDTRADGRCGRDEGARLRHRPRGRRSCSSLAPGGMMVVYGALARHREADSAALTLPLFARSLIYGMQTIPHGHLKRAIEDALLLRDARRAAPVSLSSTTG